MSAVESKNAVCAFIKHIRYFQFLFKPTPMLKKLHLHIFDITAFLLVTRAPEIGMKISLTTQKERNKQAKKETNKKAIMFLANLFIFSG